MAGIRNEGSICYSGCAEPTTVEGRTAWQASETEGSICYSGCAEPTSLEGRGTWQAAETKGSVWLLWWHIQEMLLTSLRLKPLALAVRKLFICA